MQLISAGDWGGGVLGIWQACLWMAIASQALVSVNELVVVAFKAGAEQLIAAAEALGDTKTPSQKWEDGGLLTSGYRACEFASSFNCTISIELAVEVSTGENVRCKSYEKKNCSHDCSGRSLEQSLVWKGMSAGWEFCQRIKLKQI